MMYSTSATVLPIAHAGTIVHRPVSVFRLFILSFVLSSSPVPQIVRSFIPICVTVPYNIAEVLNSNNVSVEETANTFSASRHVSLGNGLYA